MITGSVTIGSLNVGIYTATNAVTSTNALNSPQNVVVTLTVNPTIIATAGVHGIVTPGGTVVITYGGATSFVATADVYYHIGSLTTNGVSVAEATNQSVYTSVWVNVIATGTLVAAFSENLTTNTATPEWWLAQYGLTNDFNAAATNDTDGDRMPAWAEYLAGTVPTNGASVLAIQNIRVAGMVIEWPSVSGRVYGVLYVTNLPMEGFQVLGTASNLPATPDMNYYTNTTLTNASPLFYRVKVRRE